MTRWPVSAATDAPQTAQGDALTVAESDLSSHAIDTFVKVVGGRAKLTEILTIAGASAEVDQIVALLLDPRYDHLPLRRLCALANLTIVDLFTAYKKALLVEAHLRAYKEVTDRLVPVVVDVMTRAAPYHLPCEACGGQGAVPDPDDPAAAYARCVVCQGHGKLLHYPDLDRQKLALDLAQLVQKAGGSATNIIQANVSAAPAATPASRGALEALQQAVGDLLSARPLTIDVTPEPDPPPADPPEPAPG